MMWAATVVLNQHYVIDLLAGAALAGAAYLISKHLHNKLFPLIESALRNKQ
jgi:membrane-associated phospholipid phosphatase